MAPQQHDVGDDLDGQHWELVGEDGREAPAVLALVGGEAARRCCYLDEVRVASIGFRQRHRRHASPEEGSVGANIAH